MALLAQGSTVPSALVALMVFRGPAWACLFCFTSYEERVRICQIFAGVEGPELEKCQKAFITAFQGLLDIEINDYERNHLHDAFTQMTHSLQEMAMAQGSFKVAFPNAAKKMQEVIKKLKEVEACIPPCGVQEASRSFRCRGCYSDVCELSLDCPGEGRSLQGQEPDEPEGRELSGKGAGPDGAGSGGDADLSAVQDLTVTRGQQAKFSCSVNFSLPKEEITYSWKFAGGGVRTQDQSYFRDILQARGHLVRIRPVQLKHRGTYCCEISQDQFPVARVYFFLNVTGAPPRGETKLQVSFRKVLDWAPREAEMIESWRPSLGELLASSGALTPSNQCLLAAAAALASASATLVVWMFFRWYFQGN
ncbi:LOW QUALITY PROTEIN: sperm acrosome membrane-associated protein 6 [Lycaon pictus]